MDKLNKNISRRSFLKGMSGVAASVVLANTLSFSSKAYDEEMEQAQFLDNQQRVFVDSLGREVIVPQVIEKIIPSGMFAQEMISVLCPEKMMTVACEIDESEKEQYAEAGREKLCDLPETGEMYTMDGRDIDTEKIRKKRPDIVLDVGCLKDDLEFSLDYMQEKADTITIFIDGRFGKLPMAFRSLGELLDCQERAEELAVYIEGLYEDIEERKINLTSSPKILYAANELGLSKHTGYSFQNEVIRFLGGTPVDIRSGIESNQMDKESLVQENIDYVLFNNWEVFWNIQNETAKDFEIWSGISAIQEKQFAVSPGLYHSWIGFPLFVQTIGMLWMAQILWQDVYGCNLPEKIREFYILFYNYDLSNDEMVYLIGLEG